MSKLAFDIKAVGRKFLLQGDYVEAEPFGGGHINDTFAVIYDQGGSNMRYVFQRINHNIFKDPAALMDNISRVLNHSQAKLAAADAPDHRTGTGAGGCAALHR